jgi:hypothetical protein
MHVIYAIAEKNNTLRVRGMSVLKKPKQKKKNDCSNNLVSVTQKASDNHIPHEWQ